MISISRRSVYALTLVEELLRHDSPVTVAKLSTTTGLSVNLINGMTPELTRAKLVEATQGTKGGLKLRDHELTFWDLFVAIGIPIEVESETWREISSFLERTLKRTPINSLMRKDNE